MEKQPRQALAQQNDKVIAEIGEEAVLPYTADRALALCCMLIASLFFESSNSYAKTPQTATSTAQSSTPTKNMSGEGRPKEVTVTPETPDMPAGHTWEDIRSLLPWWQTVTPEILELEFKYPTTDFDLLRDWPIAYLWLNILSLETPETPWWRTVKPETLEVEHTYTYPNETLEPPEPINDLRRGQLTGTREVCNRPLWYFWLRRRCTIASVVY